MPQSQEFIVLDVTALVLVGIALPARTSQVSEEKRPVHRSVGRAPFLSRFGILLLGFTRLGTIPLLLVPNLLLLTPVVNEFKTCSPVLTGNTHPSTYQPIRPLFDIAVALATGDSRPFGARHLATPPDWRVLWLSDDSGRLRVHLGFISAFLYP